MLDGYGFEVEENASSRVLEACGRLVLVVDAVEPVVVQDLPVTQRRQDFLRKLTEACSGGQPQDFFEEGDSFDSSLFSALLKLLRVNVIGHAAARRLVAQRPTRSIRFSHEQRDNASVGTVGPLLQKGFALA